MNAEYVPKCKLLRATYKVENGSLSGPHMAEICLQREVPIHVSIHQTGTRTITVVAERDVSVQTLYSILANTEELLMIFDGKFIPLDDLCFSDSDNNTERELKQRSSHCKMRRLAYFTSSDFCEYSINTLIEFDEVLTSELFEKWKRLLDDLGIIHKMFMYSICNSGLTTDFKCAFLIEHAEAFVEIIDVYKNNFTDLESKDKRPTLKSCLHRLIMTYGADIFKDEIESDLDMVLKVLVDSRVRIMHIKRHQQKMYLNGEQSVLYSVKMYLLYRCIILDLLEIDRSSYYDKLCKCVEIWNKHKGVLHKFLTDCKCKA